MDESSEIALKIITPEGVALSLSVAELTAPGVEGDFGVLPGHRPLMAALRTGIASYRVGTEEHQVAIGPGFAEVSGHAVVLLTDRYCTKAGVDPVLARQDLREADEQLEAFDGELGGPEHGLLIRLERWAATRLELYGDPPPPTINTFDEFRTVRHADYTHGPDDDAPPS